MITGPEIYKKDSAGKTRVWQYVVTSEGYSIKSGILGGKIVESKLKKTPPKSKDTPHLQAMFEAEAAMKKKLDVDYHSNLNDIDKGPKVFLPLLAYDYSKLKKSVTFPIYAQPKFDGIRSIVRPNGQFSRRGKAQNNFDHVRQEFKRYLAGQIAFDGELYNHDYSADFDSLTSFIRSESDKSEERTLLVQSLRYNVYDMYYEGLSFEKRFECLRKIMEELNPKYSVLSETVLCENQDELDEYYIKKLQEGYEGIILRNPNGLYELDARRKDLSIKRKEFIDDEFPVLDIQPGTGNWSGAAKICLVKLPNGLTSEATFAGSYARNKERLERRDEYIDGKGTATVRFLNWTPQGRLRGGVVKDMVIGDRQD